MKKISIFWKNTSNDLINLLQRLRDSDINTSLVSSTKYTGGGEELMCNESDIDNVRELASKFNCVIDSDF